MVSMCVLKGNKGIIWLSLIYILFCLFSNIRILFLYLAEGFYFVFRKTYISIYCRSFFSKTCFLVYAWNGGQAIQEYYQLNDDNNVQ